MINTDCHSSSTQQPLTFTSKDGCLLLPSIQWMLLTDLAGDSQREIGEGVGSGRFPSSSRCLLRTAEIMLQQNKSLLKKKKQSLQDQKLYHYINYILNTLIYMIGVEGLNYQIFTLKNSFMQLFKVYCIVQSKINVIKL